MIKLKFGVPTNFGYEEMNFLIRNKEIFYCDRIFKDALRLIPRDEEFINKVRNSRNKYSAKLIEMFTLSEAQLKEYEAATTEEEIALIIKKDCLKYSLKLMKEEKDANNS